MQRRGQKKECAADCFRPKTSDGAGANTKLDRLEKSQKECNEKVTKHKHLWRPEEREHGGDEREVAQQVCFEASKHPANGADECKGAERIGQAERAKEGPQRTNETAMYKR